MPTFPQIRFRASEVAVASVPVILFVLTSRRYSAVLNIVGFFELPPVPESAVVTAEEYKCILPPCPSPLIDSPGTEPAMAVHFRHEITVLSPALLRPANSLLGTTGKCGAAQRHIQEKWCGPLSAGLR